jgi:hypothetical protein
MGFLTRRTSTAGYMTSKRSFSSAMVCTAGLWMMQVSPLKLSAEPLIVQQSPEDRRSIDEQVTQDPELALHNVFIDVTDLPATPIESASPAQEGPQGDPPLTAAFKYNLSFSKSREKTVLFWPKPDVMALANRIIAGEDIQRVKLRLIPLESSKPSEGRSETDHNDKTNPDVKQQSLRLTQNQWLAPFETLSRGILRQGSRTDGDHSRIVGQIELASTSREVQISTLARAQGYLTRSADEQLRGLWITDAAWAGATLTIVKVPNAVVRKSDVGKPSPELSILTVRKETYLGTGEDKNVSQQGLAVLGEAR